MRLQNPYNLLHDYRRTRTLYDGSKKGLIMKYKEVNEMHRGLFTQAKSVLLSVMGQIERSQIAELRLLAV